MSIPPALPFRPSRLSDKLSVSIDSQQSFEGNLLNFDSFANYSFGHPSEVPLKKAMHISILTILCLTVIAFFTAFIACFIDLVAFHLIQSKKSLTFQIENPYLGCLTWTSISVLFIICATSFGYFWAPEADGSGVPEVKAIISGVEMPKHLSWKTLICKTFGLICCSGALSIGKEGPHVHLAAIVAYRVLKFKWFKRFAQHPGVQTRVMQVSVSAGVASALVAPIGSIFFSMELTATYYTIHNIILALYCGLLSSLCVCFYRLLDLTEVISSTHIPKGYNNSDLVLFIAIGIISGIIGVYFTLLVKFLVLARSQQKIPWLHKRYRYAIFVTILYSITVYCLPSFMLSAKSSLNQLLYVKESDSSSMPDDWMIANSQYAGLLIFMSCKLIFTGFSTSVQIPGGVFLPLLMCGAAFGRSVFYFRDLIGGIASVGMYAAIGAASFVASATHSLGVCLIIFELTGQMHYAVPMLIAVILSYGIGSTIGLNIYDAIIVLKKLPYLPAIRNYKLYTTNASEVMDNPVMAPINSNNRMLRDLFFNKKTTKIVLVDEECYVIADFNVTAIQKYLRFCLEGFKPMLTNEEYCKIKNLIYNENDESMSNSEVLTLRRHSSSDNMSNFWSLPIDFSSKIFKLNRHPLILQLNTTLSKIHYLFLMLGLMQIYITKDFKLVGVIYREYFTNTKK